MSEEEGAQIERDRRWRDAIEQRALVLARWHLEDEKRRVEAAQRKAARWQTVCRTGWFCVLAGCVAGWILTRWRPPSPTVLVNYLCVLGGWGAAVRIVAVFGRRTRSRVRWPAFCALALLLGLQSWWDHYDVRSRTSSGLTIVERWGRFDSRWNHRWIATSDSFAVLRSAHGPITTSGEKHGQWVYHSRHALPSVIRWYWHDREVSKEEWLRLAQQDESKQ